MTDELRQAIESAFPDVPGEVNSKVDVNKYLYVIRKLEEEKSVLVDECEAVIKDAEAHYENKLETKQKTIDYFSGKIEAYVRANGPCDMPNGKASTRKSHSFNWKLEKDDLVSWAMEAFPDLVKSKTTFSVNKSELKKKIGDGECSAFEKVTTDKFYINLPKNGSKE